MSASKNLRGGGGFNAGPPTTAPQHASWCCALNGCIGHERPAEIPDDDVWLSVRCDNACSCEGWDETTATVLPFVRRDSGGIDGGYLLALAVILAVVLVYVAAGGAR